MRRPSPFPSVLSILVLGLTSVPMLAADAEAPRLFRQPTMSRTEIAFSFGGDLWSVARAGGEARRLTASVGYERDPLFSPDGTMLAFSGEYDGNVDVFVMPAGGGSPRRLTYHPGEDRVVGWSRDGARLIFRTERDLGGLSRLYQVDAKGGWPERLPLPQAFTGSFSPDGARLAYMPHERFQQAWKRYRGGESTFIWLVDLKTLELEAVPRTHSNDSYPAWADDGRVYFLSDREGTVGLFRYDPKSRAVDQVFANDGFDLKYLSAGPGGVVFERFGQIGLYDSASGKVDYPAIRVTSDLETIRPRYVKVGDSLQSGAISPSGARAAFSGRGEIVTVPAKKGDFRNFTRTPEAADREPSWSPDGKTIAWISDASGDIALHLAPADGLSPGRHLAPPAPSFLYAPVWSPDGKRIALHDQALRLWMVELGSGKWTHVDTDTYETPARTFDPAWSPDSRYLVYTKRERSFQHAVYVRDIKAESSRRISDALGDARFAVFDASGKYLWVTVSTDVGPTMPWLDMTGLEHPVRRSLWLAVLAADEPSPYPHESDEEKGGDEEKTTNDAVAKNEGKDDKGKDKGKGKAGDEDEQVETPEPAKTKIDFEGLERRFIPVPGVAEAQYVSLQAGEAGEVFLLESPKVQDAVADGPAAGPLWKVAIEGRKTDQWLPAAVGFRVSADGAKLLAQSADGWSIVGTDAAPAAGDGALSLGAVEVRVDPPAEWRQIYRESWRLQRDFFYDANYHGLDLGATEAKYRPYLAGLANRDDLDYLLIEALGNLTIGHLYVFGGERSPAARVRGGLLGADWEIAEGRYRLARVFSSESWNPMLPAPLDGPGVSAKAGEYLIAVEGREIRPPESVYGAFESTAGRRVRIRIGPDPSGKGARDLTVVPLPHERTLRYRAWVEDNRRRAEKLSGGKVGYVHLPDTGGSGYQSFNRYFFSQSDRPALLIDERNNGGGFIADYVVEVLNRKPLWAVAGRAGSDMLSPAGAHYGPKAMLINRHAGSGGDALPWMFRKLGLGPLVGTRTWGGLVGIWDFPGLVDGGLVTAPRGGLYTIDGKWEVENQGVAPDVEVEITPRDFAEGRDPQLERGVELLMKALEAGPPKLPVRPEFPNYQVSPWRSEAKQ